MIYTASYFEFESVFWISLGFVVIFFLMRNVPKQYRFLGGVTSTTLFIFATSSLFETYVSNSPVLSLSFLMLKMWGIAALVISILIYFDVRRAEFLKRQSTFTFTGKPDRASL